MEAGKREQQGSGYYAAQREEIEEIVAKSLPTSLRRERQRDFQMFRQNPEKLVLDHRSGSFFASDLVGCVSSLWQPNWL